MSRMISVCAALVGLTACGIDPAKVSPAKVYAEAGSKVVSDRPVTFALVGATRGGIGFESPDADAVIADVRAEAPLRDLRFVMLSGDYVLRSTTAEWDSFAARWADVLDLPVTSTNKARKPVVAIPGNGERVGDPKLKAFGAAFPGLVNDIGYNRVASWGSIDIEAQGATWRILLADSNRKELGSRWEEQSFWLPKAVKGDFDHLVVVMPDPLVTLAAGTSMDDDGGPSEILSIIDEHAGVGDLKLVIGGGTGTNEFFLPTGTYGEGYLVAGNSGVATPQLARWAKGESLPYAEVSHEPLFGLALMAAFDARAADGGYAEKTIEHARGSGAWEGFDAAFEAGTLPLVGWWAVSIAGDVVTVTYRQQQPDGSFRDVWTGRGDASKGWSTTRN